MATDNVYTTPDRGLAAYIMLRGGYCVGAVPANDSGNPERRNFVFIDVADPKELEDSWFRNKKELMSAKSYFDKMRLAIRMAKDPMTAEVFNKITRGDDA